MIDLAGSERAAKTDNSGMRLTEGKRVVISKVHVAHRRRRHQPLSSYYCLLLPTTAYYCLPVIAAYYYY
eukprot:scaffold36378_cov43-Phaeocystis_antarctica.AAC.2